MLNGVAALEIPEYPSICRETVASDVKEGDRLDVALLKTDAALGTANNKLVSCGAWYDNIRETAGAPIE